MPTFRDAVLRKLDGRRGATIDGTVAELIADAITALHDTALADLRLERDEARRKGEALAEAAAALLLAKDSLLAAYRVGNLVSGDKAITALEVAEPRWSTALSAFRATSGAKCETCGGTGTVDDDNGYVMTTYPCPDCASNVDARLKDQILTGTEPLSSDCAKEKP